MPVTRDCRATGPFVIVTASAPCHGPGRRNQPLCYANNGSSWLRRPGPWQGAEAVTVMADSAGPAQAAAVTVQYVRASLASLGGLKPDSQLADSLRLAVSSSGLGGGTPAHLDVRMLISKTIEGQSIFMKGRAPRAEVRRGGAGSDA